MSVDDLMTKKRHVLSRRRFLQTTGATGVAGFAGCTGNSTNDGEDGPTESDPAEGESNEQSADTQAGDSDFTVALQITNSNINFNEFNFADYSWDLAGLLYDPLAQWHPKKQEWIPILLEDWSIGKDVLTLTIRDGYTWHNGNDLTAEDVAKSLQLEIWMEFSVSEYAKSATATGDRTVELPLRDDFNENVVEHELLGGTWISKPPHVYEEWITKFQNASGEEERKQVQSKLSEWKLTEPNGYGPLKVVDMNQQRITMEPFGDHPQGGAMNFDTYTVEFISSNQNIWQSLGSDRLDGVPGVFAPKEVADSFPNHVMETLHATNNGFALEFDHDHPDFGKRKVRQAIAHVVDRTQVAQNSGAETKQPVELITGVPQAGDEQWLGGIADSLTRYEPNAEKAASLMKEAGYQKNGGTWAGSNGPVSGNFIVRAGWADYVTAAQTITSQLKNFGIDVQLTTKESSTYSDVYDKGNFDLAAGGWGGGPYPLFAYQGSLNEDNRGPINYPAEVTVPAMDGSSGSLTVNFPSILSRVNRSAENDDEAFKTLSWAWNQDLPKLPIQQKLQQSFITTDAWTVPSKDDPVMSIDDPPTWLPKVGKLQAK